MHDLRLVGVHDDGEHLLLSGPDGEQYLLAVDEPLRAAVRRDRAHLGQLQIQMSGDLRPREVQAQIRAGATADEVAERCGWPLDRVRRYEGAVLAEREHVIALARGVTMRRRSSDPGAQTLSARVEQRLSARGVEVRGTVWDSWRTEDGPWMVTLRFAAGGREREARWAYDASTRTVTPQDDEAMWLSEDEKPPAAPIPAPHLAAVPTLTAPPPLPPDVAPAGAGEVYDVEAEGGLTASQRLDLDASSAVDLVGAMRARRHGRRRSGSSAPEAQQHLEIEPATFDPSLISDPPAPHPFPFPERLRDRDDAPDDDADEPSPPQDRTTSAAQSAADVGAEHAPPPAPPRNFGPPGRPVMPAQESLTGGQRRARRPSVPSWDEIMFGGKRD
ncbi:MAG: septation protein SepH [Actinomycetales bacterium]